MEFFLRSCQFRVIFDAFNDAPSHPRWAHSLFPSFSSLIFAPMPRILCFRVALGLIAGLVGLVPGPVQAAPNPSFTSSASVHDPAIFRDGSTYYVYGSHMASASSTDLMNWTQLSSSVAVGNPLVPNPFVDYADVFTWAATTTFWAPDVIKLADGRYYFYYCACKGDSPLSALGLAISSAAPGPYVNQGIMLKSGMWGSPSPDGKNYDNAIHPNVVDPCVFFDKAGKFWMVYGSYSGGIFIMELDPVTGKIKTGQGYGKKLMGGNNSTIEGPCITYSPETDYYYLFVTYGGLDAAGGYNIRVSRSRNADGPYLDVAGNDMSTVAGKVGTFFDNVSIAPYGLKLMGNYQFAHVTADTGATSRGYLSPGGSSIYRDPATGRTILTIHLRFVGRGEQHEVRTYQLYMNADAWPVCSPHRFAKEALATTISANVPGQYKIINHGKDITATVKVSAVSELKADGTISGSSSGTWALTGDHYATIVLDGVSYKGVFAQHWDDDNTNWVGTFSAISSEGIALWGSKVSAVTTDSSPTINLQAVNQTVSAGNPVSFSVSATGTPAPSYQWRKNGVNISGATNGTYTITTTKESDAGYYCCVVGNRATAYLSEPATLVVTAAVIPITTQPQSLSVTAGASASFSVGMSGTGFTYQWRKYNDAGVAQAISGAKSATLTYSEVSSEEAGSYDCVVTQGSSTVVTQIVSLKVAILLSSNPSARLINLSARTRVKSGTEATVVGFVLSGAGNETLLVRAAGPALKDFFVTDYLADPTMEFYNQNDISTPVASNDNWSSDNEAALRASFTKTYAFNWATGSLDAAILKTLSSGAYTANVKAKTSSGIGLVEVYEDNTSGPRMVNMSCRAVVSSGQDALVAGFVVGGTGLKTLLIRVSGPALKAFLSGYASDPILKIYDQKDISTPFAVNDDWDSDTTKGDQIDTIGKQLWAFAWTRGSTDAAILVTLRPGNYTAEGSSKTGSGIELVEVYEVNQ